MALKPMIPRPRTPSVETVSTPEQAPATPVPMPKPASIQKVEPPVAAKPITATDLYLAVLQRIAPDPLAKWSEWVKHVKAVKDAMPLCISHDEAVMQACTPDLQAATKGVCLAMMDAFRNYSYGAGIGAHEGLREAITSSYDLREDLAELELVLVNSILYAEFAKVLAQAVHFQVYCYWTNIEYLDSTELVKCALRAALRMKHIEAWLAGCTGDTTTIAVTVGKYLEQKVPKFGWSVAHPEAWMELSMQAECDSTKALQPVSGDNMDMEYEPWTTKIDNEVPDVPWD